MNGFQFVRMARELRPDLKVIFMTDFEINISEFDKIHPSMKVCGLIKKPILMRNLEALFKNATTATPMKRKNAEIDESNLEKNLMPLISREAYDKFIQDVQKKIDDADRSEVAHDGPLKC